MPRTLPPLLPRLQREFDTLGANLKLARLRRKYSAAQVAQRAGITRKTLQRVEQGDPSVSFGIYARVLQVLRLEEGIGKLGADDLLGQKLQDSALERQVRVGRPRKPTL